MVMRGGRNNRIGMSAIPPAVPCAGTRGVAVPAAVTEAIASRGVKDVVEGGDDHGVASASSAANTDEKP